MLTRRAAAGLLALLAAAGCSTAGGTPPPAPAPSGAGSATGGTPSAAGQASAAIPSAGPSAGPSPTETARVEAQLAALTLEQRVGQVFAPYVFGRTAEDRRPEIVAANRALLGVDTAAEAVTRWHLGGVLLLDRNPLDSPRARLSTGNVDSPATTARLTAGLQAAAAAAGDPTLVVAVDQEGGPVTRLGAPFVALPSAMAFGAAGDAGPAFAERAARASGGELRSVGITLDLAPVADVNTDPRNPVIGERAFGDRPDPVSDLVAAAVRGYTAAGVGSALKHFPGHGGTDVDSHAALPTITRSRADLDRTDLAPFRAGAAAGVPAVLLGHLLVPALDPDVPTTLSPAVLRLLRDELGFDGVAITDGLFMRALRDRYGDDEVAVRALGAGMDLLLQPPSLPTSYAAVLAAVRDGSLPAARLDEAVRRILTLKDRFPPAAGTLEAGPRLAPDGTELVRAIGAASVTVVRDCLRRLPAREFTVVSTGPASDALRSALAARGATRPGGLSVSVGNDPGDAQVRVATGAPYPLGGGSTAVTTVAAYAATPGQLAAVADVLTGAAPARGRLPVAVDVPAC